MISTKNRIVINNCVWDYEQGSYFDISDPNKPVRASDKQVLEYLMVENKDMLINNRADDLLLTIFLCSHFNTSNMKELFSLILNTAEEIQTLKWHMIQVQMQTLNSIRH